MSVFTDDDLKLWKADIGNLKIDWLAVDKQKALLTRLEAAEVLATRMASGQTFTAKLASEVEAWHKVAGK